MRLPDTWSTLASTLTRPDGPAAGVVERTSEAARVVRRVVTPVGWAVLATTITAWLLGWQLGWREAMLLAAAGLLLLVMSLVFLIGRATLHVNVMLQPRRVSAVSRSPPREALLQGTTVQRTTPLHDTLTLPLLLRGGRERALRRLARRGCVQRT